MGVRWTAEVVGQRHRRLVQRPLALSSLSLLSPIAAAARDCTNRLRAGAIVIGIHGCRWGSCCSFAFSLRCSYAVICTCAHGLRALVSTDTVL